MEFRLNYSDESHMSHGLRYRWVKHYYTWVSDKSRDRLWVDHIWVSDELHIGYTFKNDIAHLLQTYQSLTPIDLNKIFIESKLMERLRKIANTLNHLFVNFK